MNAELLSDFVPELFIARKLFPQNGNLLELGGIGGEISQFRKDLLWRFGFRKQSFNRRPHSVKRDITPKWRARRYENYLSAKIESKSWTLANRRQTSSHRIVKYVICLPGAAYPSRQQ